ncbi:MAG: YraN family protein [Bacillota bacterium]
MTKELGLYGEDLALSELKKKGYLILDRNFKCKIGEIDIIARDKNHLVFIEVRSKTDASSGLPQETVNNTKKRKIRRVAEYYLLKNNLLEEYCRFDVVGIVWTGINPEICIIQDAF